MTSKNKKEKLDKLKYYKNLYKDTRNIDDFIYDIALEHISLKKAKQDYAQTRSNS